MFLPPATTYYISVGNCPCFVDSTEANKRVRFQSAGTLSNLSIKCTTNSTTSSTTFTSRKNSANGNMTISIPAGTTGNYSDTIHTDSVAAGDYLAIKAVVGSSYSIYCSCVNTVFEATSGTMTKYIAQGSAGWDMSGPNSSTVYCGLGGYPGSSTYVLGTATEAYAQFKCRTAGTLKNMCLYTSSNSRNVTDTFRVRINGVNGNVVISRGASATGLFENTTNTDSVASGDLINFSITGGASASTSRIDVLGVEMYTTNNKFNTIASESEGLLQNPATTTSYAFAGDPYYGGQSISPMAFTASNMQIYISANSGLSSNSTFAFRKNATNGNQIISIPVNSTGLFEDTVNTDSVVINDLINTRLITP